MGGSRVDLKKEHSTKTQSELEQQHESRQELPADVERPAQGEKDEIEATQQDFDPETADREALLAMYRQLEGQLDGANDRLLRTAADAENYRKRLQREKEEQTRYANEAIMRDLLAVIDNLERALDHSQAESEQGGLVEGLKMTIDGFLNTFARFGCTPLEAVGKVFDPNFHEAVLQEETADHEDNTVLRELQKGYMLKERLLRPAMVVVSKAPSKRGDPTQQQVEDRGDRTEAGKVRIKVSKA